MRFLGFVANIGGSERNISVNIEVRGKPDGHLPGVLTICIETRKFRAEFKWNGSFRWKFSGKK